jgi:hypothetical protein
VSERRAPGADERGWVRRVARAIAVAFASGDHDPPAMATRAARAIGDELDDWLLPLAREIAELWPTPGEAGGDLLDALITLILRCDTFTYQTRRPLDDGSPWDPESVLDAPSELAPRWLPAAGDLDAETREATAAAPALAGVALPLARPRDLGELLGLHPLQLAWYADVRSMERDAAAEPLRHYTYRWFPKRGGGARLLESPKPMLRFFQRRILHEIVEPIPPHAAAHGFCRGRSVHSFAEPHVGRAVVIRVDLEAFFASVRAGRVFAILQRAGYPPAVAHQLTGLATNVVPHHVRRAAPRPPAARLDAHRRALVYLATPHLPQGAPTSPALANLAAYGLDRRLSGLARSFDATYTRYADDLAFSGGPRLARHAPRLVALVGDIARSEGFRLNDGKTRVMRSSQRQALAGLVVNERAQPSRADYDRLKAVLHDAARHGPASANRRGHPDFQAHLLGRIGWIAGANPARAEHLRAQFDAIDW